MEITLSELLDAREERVMMQQKLLGQTGCPLICFTMNVAGPVKTSPLVIRAFKYGISLLEKSFCGFEISNRVVNYQKSGPVAYYSVKGNGEDIKRKCVIIEESCAMGRLFDMDVIDLSGVKYERLSQRSCIVCGKEGRECAAGRLHSVELLQQTTKSMIINHFADFDSSRLAHLAKCSLVSEVITTPKPGLVDWANNGSHNDMNLDSFMKSSEALQPYFKLCVQKGIESGNMPPECTFAQLRPAGVEAEKTMYRATGGVNTHKGIIYSMGIILGAVGRLWNCDSPKYDTDALLEECSRMVRPSVKEELCSLDGSTAGGRAYLSKGERGIRGEAADGFPSVKNIAIPAYKNALLQGKNKNDAGVFALLHLIAQIYDTNIYNRGGKDGVEYARAYAKEVLSKKELDLNDVKRMDEDFIKRNLSPGGAADLLAITYFLTDLESKTAGE